MYIANSRMITHKISLEKNIINILRKGKNHIKHFIKTTKGMKRVEDENRNKGQSVAVKRKQSRMWGKLFDHISNHFELH